MHRRLLYLFLVIPVLVVSGCAGSSATAPERDYFAESQRFKKIDSMNERLIMDSMIKAKAAESDYIIGSEDLLDIDVFQVEELKKSVRVSAQGNIGLPLVGTIKAQGMTAMGLENEISKRLGDKYIEDPVVSVFVREYRSQKISVLGAVGLPQVYAVSGQRYLLELIALAGGFTKEAGDIAYVLRPVASAEGGGSSSMTETIVVDLGSLLIDGNYSLNIPVFSGDIINIPKAGVVFVDGAVEKPGAFPLQAKTTLVQAISMAEGCKFEADKSDVRIFRDNGKGEREVIKIDYGAAKDGKGKDPVIQANDVIIVPKSGVKNFFSGFVNFFRGVLSFGLQI